MTKDEKEILTGFLIQSITASGYTNQSGEIEFKIDVLERALEVLRHEYKHIKNKLPFEEFLSGTIALKNGRLNFIASEKTKDFGTGTAAVRLQPKLLLFLLLYHRNYFKIYDIIDKFVEKIWNELQVIDFKKTQTGVTRCFTNTRFAATTLREYGFLKYTDDEAFKTWTLSLPGFVVAAKVLEDQSWNIPDFQKQTQSDLHPDIHQAWADLRTSDAFIERLQSICDPNAKVFTTFRPLLVTTHKVLEDYWKTLLDNDIPQRDRKKESIKLLKQLDKEPHILDLYDELLKSLKSSFAGPWAN